MLVFVLFLLHVKSGSTPTCLQCPDRCKLLFRCREARFVHSCIEKHGNKKNLSWHFLSDSLKTPPMPVLAGVWPGSGDGIERALKWGIRASA